MHDRMNVGDGTNECRDAPPGCLHGRTSGNFHAEASENDSFVWSCIQCPWRICGDRPFEKDCSKIAKAILKNESLGKFTIDGTTSLDYLGFDEFYPDQDSLADVVLQLFYEKL